MVNYMAKIIFNTCFGGASLSDKAIERYAELKGITLYKGEQSSFGGSHHYYLCSESERRTWLDTDPKHNDMYFSCRDILADRTDPVLIQVIEELGNDANGWAADLQITELPAGTQYHIHEYDGNERIMTPDDYKWEIA